MATISSAGIGSGLDVNSIVTQLVALEKTPLKSLEVKATNFKAQISAFGEIQSQVAALTTVATRIADPAAWAARKASSSNEAVATIATTSSAAATSFTLDVDALAQQQSVSTTAMTPGSVPGAGTLTLQLGVWGAGGASFTAGTAVAVDVTIGATDTLSAIAGKINGANAGVVATVFNDGVNDRLLLTSKTTGAAAGFKVTSADPALAGFVFDPETQPGSGMADAQNPVQYSQDAKARINGLTVTSATNTLTDNLPGVTIKLLSTTTSNYGSTSEVKAPISMGISEDVTLAVRNVSDFVDAYNTLNASLSASIKYDSATKTAGLFQGDSSIVGLQNLMRTMIGSSSLGAVSQRLADMGIERQTDGSLTINTDKLSISANNGTALQQLFTNNNNNTLTNGFAVKFRDFGVAVAASSGSLTNKAKSLQTSLTNNSTEQTKVNDRATLFETRLRARYTALDVQMAQLTALNSYIAQQVTIWNKSTA